MRKSLGIIAFLFSSTVLAQAPYVVSDLLDSRADKCGVFLDAVPKVTVPVALAVLPVVGNICKYSVAFVTVGVHSITMTAINSLDTTVWGESAQSVPLSFTRPTAIGIPTNLRMVSQ